MAQNETHQIEIYIGSQIEHASERDVLDRLVELLTKNGRSAIILANLSFESRQIDFVVGLKDLTLVIEAKGYARPVRGGENGYWQVQLATGTWKNFRNPYVQARDASLSLRDAMRSFTKVEVPYPAAALVFAPNIPRGSDPHAGDFKVSVVGLDGLDDVLQKMRDDVWPLEKWREFARHCRLTPVDTPDAAFCPALAEAEELLSRYAAAFSRMYEPASKYLVPFTCHSNGDALSSEEVVHLVSVEGADILLRGASGCGKSLLAEQIGVEFSQYGGVAMIIPARDYDGRIKTVLDCEAGLLEVPSATKLLDAGRRLNRPFLFVLDGYNECVEPKRSSLTRGLAALAQKYVSSILVTSQIPLQRVDLIALLNVEVPVPDDVTKIAIARRAADDSALAPEIESLLAAVTSGLEARLVGEVGHDVDTGCSRYGFFDAFIRKRLGDMASEGIRGLAHVAAYLSGHVTFSLSVRDLDRLAEAKKFPPSLIGQLRASDLLRQRGDRVGFPHEMFFQAFGAEAVIRRAAGQIEPVLAALVSPLHAGRKEMIVGAIDDDSLLEKILEGQSDGAIVIACLSSACGRRAQQWTEARCQNVLDQLREEALNIRFKLSGEGIWGVTFEADSLRTWLKPDKAILAAMPQLLAEGRYLRSILEIIGLMDQRIDEEQRRLREKSGDGRTEIGDATFAISYVFSPSNAPGITQICSRLHSGLSRRIQSEVLAQVIESRLPQNDFSPGQIYLILNLCRWVRDGYTLVAPLVIRALQSNWSSSPYHLRLDLLDAARLCGQAEEADRKALIEAIESLPQRQHIFISSLIIEVLQSLGALDVSEREHQDVVLQEINQCLANSGNLENCAAAYHVYYAQFDHPFAGAYCEAVSSLSSDERKHLLTMAAKGADDSAFWLSALITDLASYGDPESGEIICRWTALPPTDSPMYQDAIGVFVAAHIVLGRLGCPLPNRLTAANSPSASALAACGAILYWCNRTDLNYDSRQSACHAPLSVLARYDLGAALYAIRHCEHVLVEGVDHLPGEGAVERSIISCFPRDVTEICREALRRPTTQVGYFRHFSDFDRQRNMEFAMDVIARHGNAVDAMLFRRYADDPTLGATAIAAVKTLEDRGATS